MNYYSADFHFGSPNMIDRWDRKASDSEKFDEMIINNINNLLTPHDILYIVGDVGSYRTSTSEKIRQLNCEKQLVIGNHDISLLKHKSFRDLFEKIGQNMIIQDGDYRIVLNHYPLAEWEGFYRGNTYHFYAHAHKGNPIMDLLDKAICVSIDCNNNIPKTADELINEKKQATIQLKPENMNTLEFIKAYQNGNFGFSKNNQI